MGPLRFKIIQLFLTDVFTCEYGLPPFLQRKPLAVNHGFILPQKLTEREVLTFDHALHLIGTSAKERVVAVADHQIVLQGDDEARDAGVALASGAPAQLVVDAPAFVAVGAPHPDLPPVSPPPRGVCCRVPPRPFCGDGYPPAFAPRRPHGPT